MRDVRSTRAKEAGWFWFQAMARPPSRVFMNGVVRQGWEWASANSPPLTSRTPLMRVPSGSPAAREQLKDHEAGVVERHRDRAGDAVRGPQGFDEVGALDG